MFASSFSFLPKKMEILTEEPTPIKSASEKLISTNGKRRIKSGESSLPQQISHKNSVE